MIELNGVTKDYGQNRGVFGLTLTIEKGEVFGFLGPNGAGKTTTIRQLMGFISPDQGSCRVGGMDCRKQTADIQKTLGYLPGEIAFMDDMSGMGFIRFIAELKGIRDLTAARELMDRFELSANGKIRRMSKGMKQKVGIVCAFMGDPEVLLLDEPTSGLDPLMQNRFVELVLEQREKGKTIFMSSHMFEEVERTCGRVGIIRDGRLVTVDTIAALKESRQKRYTVAFASPDKAAAFAASFPGAVQSSGSRVHVSVQGELTPLIQALSGYRIMALDAESQSLEDIFMHFYGGERHD